MTVKLIDGFYVDENGNKWDSNKFTKYEATWHSKSLGDCHDCIDCINCEYCVDCINCTDCYFCTECNNCKNCEKCYNCVDLNNQINSSNH